MKRNKNEVPEFDEIIFTNRNRSYGAYDLRKRYKWATTLSVFGGVALCTALLLMLASLNQDEVLAASGKKVIVIIQPESNLKIVKPPEPERPAPAPIQNRYIAPDVVDDSIRITEPMQITDFALDSIQNGTVTNNLSSTYIPEPEVPVEPEPVIRVEEMPQFPGGDAALLKYIAEGLKYPDEAAVNNIQGKVIIKFVITSDGSVNRVEVLRGIHPLLDQEAIRVVSSLPRWKPGRQNGNPVPVWFFVPVSFKIKLQ